MNAQPHHRGTHPLTAARTDGARLGRLTAVLAAITASLLVTVASMPAAFARAVPPPGGSYGPAPARLPVPDPSVGVPEPWPGANLPPAHIPPAIHTVTRTIVAGGMTGWQITLIALAAALVAATTAVLVDRTWTARRGATAA